MSSPLENTPSATSPGAEAIITNWDGHFVVDNSTYSSRLCCTVGDLMHCRTQPQNGPNKERTAKRSSRNCIRSLNNVDSSTSSSCGNEEEENGARHSVRRWCSGARRSRRYTDTIAKRAMGSSNSPNEHDRKYSRKARSWGGGATSIGGISRNSSARLEGAQFVSRQTTMSSSLLADSMTEIVIEDLQHEHEPTTAILDYCKRKFLRPYVVILSLVGLSPMSTDTTICRACLGYFQALFMIVLLIFGYFLQYFCGYRGDRGFANYRKILPTASSVPVTSADQLSYSSNQASTHTIGELLFGYVIPNSLHLCGFVSAVIVCKIVGKEQLQQLVERVFLVSMKPRRLCRMLWLYVASGLMLLASLVAYVMPSVLMQSQMVQVKWVTTMLSDYQVTLKFTLLFSIFVQDLVEIVILSSYCIECYLLRIHLATLSHKLLMHSIESLDWMREVLEFRKLLDHLNQRVAVPVCFFIVMNLAYAFAGFVYLFNDFDFHYSALKVVVLNIINVLLWLFMGLVPFFMAASVTRVCQTAQANGHQIRVRPFVYHNTSTDDLNSTLLFASSLDMSAKLFRMPIQPNYVCFAILVVAIVILTLGMCLNLSLLGDF